VIHFRGEADPVRQGLNLYHPREWKWHVGFILRIGNWGWKLRYSFRVHKLFCYTIDGTP